MKNLIDSIRAEMHRSGGATPEVFAQIEKAIRDEPRNAELWLLRGDAIQQSDELTNPLTEVERSYRKAIEIDPKLAPAHEALGHFWFAVMDDPAKAKPYFEQAIRLGAGESVRTALQEALAELKHRRH